MGRLQSGGSLYRKVSSYCTAASKRSDGTLKITVSLFNLTFETERCDPQYRLRRICFNQNGFL